MSSATSAEHLKVFIPIRLPRLPMQISIIFYRIRYLGYFYGIWKMWNFDYNFVSKKQQIFIYEHPSTLLVIYEKFQWQLMFVIILLFDIFSVHAVNYYVSSSRKLQLHYVTQ